MSTVEPLLLTAKQAAQTLAVSERTLWSLTAAGEIPCVKLARAVRYCVEDLRAWIAARKSKANRLS